MLHLCAHPGAERRVKIAERFVEEEDERLLDKGSTERHPLLLPARKLGRSAVQEVRDVEHLGHRCDAIGDLGDAPATELEREADVLEDGHVRVERIVLEDHRHPPLIRRHPRDVLIAQQDPSSIGLVQTGDEIEGRALAAAGRAQERHEGTFRDLEIQVVHRADGPIAASQMSEAERGDDH